MITFCSTSRLHRSRGVALVIVLAFVVLLTGVIIAYFSRAMNNRQLSSSSFNQNASDELARSGLDVVVSDIEQEIVNGSNATTGPNGSTVTGSTIYIPGMATDTTAAQAAAHAIPVPNGTPALSNGISPIPTLIRISTSSAIPAPGVDHAASVAPSTALSANGRSVSPQRWNAHYLIPRATPAVSSTDSTPVASFPAPNWVYVTGNGPAVPALAAPNSSVVGRYAYAVYNEGALLDMNVAGFPFNVMPASTANPGPTPANQMKPFGYAGKGSVAFADLTQLTDSSGNPVLNNNAIGDIAGWRNYASAQVSGTFPGFNLTASNATSFFDFILGNKNGFTQVTVPGTVPPTSPTDQAFLTRQQLLGLQQAILQQDKSAVFSVDALPYLGTFSRTINAPTWRPLLNAVNIPGYVGGTTRGVFPIAYKDNAENTTATLPSVPITQTPLAQYSASGTLSTSSSMGNPNRDLANVRFTTAGTVTHYMDDATTATYTVNAGDPLLNSRFSLARLAWLSQANPNTHSGPTTYATAIQSCFGLTWGAVGAANGGNPCWSYNAGTIPGVIETLDQVAQEKVPREANFFELLKAAILAGSLGENGGPTAFNNGSPGPYDFNYKDNGTPLTMGCDGDYGFSFDRTTAAAIPVPARIPDMQIMQIGANIIDQYDADSYPTAIYLKYPGIGAYDPTPPQDGPGDVVYGQENLPYLHGIIGITCTVDGQPVTGHGHTAGLAAYWQPEIWNPHQVANVSNPGATPPTTPPTTFQVSAYGHAYMTWNQDGSQATATIPADPGDSGQTSTALGLNSEVITFTDPALASSSPASSPFYVGPRLLTQTGLGSTTVTANHTAQMLANANMKNYASNPFVAFYLGQDANYNGGLLFSQTNADGQGTEFVNTEIKGSGACGFWLGWVDASGSLHPYSFLSGVFTSSYAVINNRDDEPMGDVRPSEISAESHMYVDPLTFRFSFFHRWQTSPGLTPLNGGYGEGPAVVTQYYRNGDGTGWGEPNAYNFWYFNEPGGPFTGGNPSGYPPFYPGDWVFNQSSPAAANPPPASPAANTGTPGLTYYQDLDGVVRPGDGYNGNVTTFDGVSDILQAGSPTGSPLASSDSGANAAHGRRPIILNRPFRSVGELGYASRDLPFKTLDFSTSASADAALLDVFCLTDTVQITGSVLRSMSAGQVSLNYAPTQVAQAILAGASKKDADATFNLGAIDAPPIAKQLTAQLNPSSGPVVPVTNRADLPAILNAAINKAITATPSSSYANKAYREAPLRALADVTNTRTWNLLIDVVAQPGVFAPSAPATPAALNSGFVVQGESRYWLHIAIDRYTGKVVDQQLERVYE